VHVLDGKLAKKSSSDDQARLLTLDEAAALLDRLS
jgi:hypothetical protein